jgi:hypothetical protein
MVNSYVSLCRDYDLFFPLNAIEQTINLFTFCLFDLIILEDFESFGQFCDIAFEAKLIF